MGTIWQDMRYGVRMLAKSPGFTLVAVLTLALGIGANTAIFGVVNTLLLRPMPVKDPQEIYVLAFQQKQGPVQILFSVADFRDLRKQAADAFSELIAYAVGMDGLIVNGKADRILTCYVSGNFFTGLGIQPALGRLILPSEGETALADPVLVLSYAYWQTHFGGDPGIVGRKVSVDGQPVTIVGVTPREFDHLNAFFSVQGFLPLGMAFIEGYPSDLMTNRQNRSVLLLGRLRRERNLNQAQASLGVLSQQLSLAYPADDKDISIRAYPELRARPVPDPKNTTLIISMLFLGLAVLVLLLACVNVANILLVRATVRGREMAIRAALGAARSRLIRQLLTESILLALGGGAAGMLLGRWGSQAISAIPIQADVPTRFEFAFDWRVFSFALGAAVLTGLMVGIVPALRASRGSLSAILHASGRGVLGSGHRLRSALVVAQVGGSLTLLIMAGLFARSLEAAERMNDLGFDPGHVLNLSMDPNEIGYNEQQGREFYKNLLSRVRALPGVVSASLANSVPMGYYGNFDALRIEGYEPPAGKPAPAVNYNTVSTDYFKTMGIAMLRGRAFREADDDKSPYVAVVNEAMVREFWPNQDPLGRRFLIGSDLKHSIEVAGVARDSRVQGLTGPVNPYFYLPYVQHYAINSLETLQVRTAGPPASMVPEIERVIAGLAPDLPIFDVKTMTEALDTLNGLLLYQLGAVLAALFGMLGLVLAIVGVYGVISYAASQRTREIGIRMALGARPTDIRKMVFRQGALIVGLGLVIGIAAGLASARVAGELLTVSATDPVAYLTSSVLLALVALAACYLPARRAMRVDPMVALRYE